jgi:hypothetical protein
MTEATQFDPDRLRVALDHGEVVELDGGTLVVDGEESPSVVLRLAPWRARSVAQALEEWSAASAVFNRASRPSPAELNLSRTLELAASVLGDGDEPLLRFPRGDYGDNPVPNQQRLAAVAVLAEREAGLSAVQRLALVDAAAWWLTDPAGGQELAHALIDGACADQVTAEHVYLALITPPDQSADQPG